MRPPLRPISANNESPSLGRSPTQQSRIATRQDINAYESIRLRDIAATTSNESNLSDGSNHQVTFGYDSESEDERAEKESPQRIRPSMLPCPSSIDRQSSFVDQDQAPSNPSPPPKTGPVAWKDLPSKRQLIILTLARLSEPLTQTSLQAYMFYQLKSFDPGLPDSTISAQAGMLQGSFTAAQFITAIMWGRVADTDWGGRKRVLVAGLLGTCLSCVGFGFSRTFAQAAVFRTLGGALNGNVGVMRTMISEIIQEKRFQSRAFLILPMCFNIGVIIGPILGGLLANPVDSYPKIFGDNSILGGKHGVWWMTHWPYALPNLLSAFFLLVAACGVVFGLEETLDSLRDKPDIGLRIGKYITDLLLRLFRRPNHRYTALSADDSMQPSPWRSTGFNCDLEPQTHSFKPSSSPKKLKIKLPFRRIWTRNVLSTLLCHFLLAFHVGTFQNLWFIFLSAPRFDSAHSHTSQRLPFVFTGGLGMPPPSVGLAMAVLGVIGITLQLLLYPPTTTRFGTLVCFRWSLALFPLAYVLAPYLALVPSTTLPPTQASGPLLWLALSLVLLIQVLARTFALPGSIILLNNCSPHPSVLGTLHGIAQSVGSAARTVGPLLGGWGFGKGLEKGVVGGVWWCLAGVAAVGWVTGWGVKEGNGHEIWLEGEEGEEVEDEEAKEMRRR